MGKIITVRSTEDKSFKDKLKFIKMLYVDPPKDEDMYILFYKESDNDTKLEYAGFCTIFKDIFILPKYQRRGFGTQIIKSWEYDWFKKNSLPLELEVLEKAIPFWKKMGYTRVIYPEYKPTVITGPHSGFVYKKQSI